MQTNEIIRSLVKTSERIMFLPSLLGSFFPIGENVAYRFARSFSPDYDGGYWEFFKLSNGTGYMAPDDKKKFRFISNLNFANEEMSADAFGIVITIYVFSYVAEKMPSSDARDRIIHSVACLKDYANQHPEGSKIFRAID